MDHLGNRNPHGEARPRFLLDHLGARGLGPLEDLFAEPVGEAGKLLKRQPGDARATPNGHHAVAVLPEDQRLELRGRRSEPHRQQAAEAERIEERSEANHTAGGQGEFLLGKVGEDVDRVTHHEYGRVGPQAVGLD